MIHTEAFQQYVHSPAFLDPLGLPPGTDIPFASLNCLRVLRPHRPAPHRPHTPAPVL